MAKKYGHTKIMADADKALGKGLPPVLIGPPTWHPRGYVCTPADVTELMVPGHRRVTAKDKEAFCKAWNAERTERESATPRPAPAPAPPPPRPTPAELPDVDHRADWYDQESRRREASLREAASRPARLFEPHGL